MRFNWLVMTRVGLAIFACKAWAPGDPIEKSPKATAGRRRPQVAIAMYKTSSSFNHTLGQSKGPPKRASFTTLSFLSGFANPIGKKSCRRGLPSLF